MVANNNRQSCRDRLIGHPRFKLSLIKRRHNIARFTNHIHCLHLERDIIREPSCLLMLSHHDIIACVQVCMRIQWRVVNARGYAVRLC